MNQTDTIAAIATAYGNSGIGIVRISGDEAVDIADKIFCMGKRRKTLSKMKSHTIHYGYVYDENGPVDEVLVMLMRGPKSFTTEDTVEINCHGGMLVVKRVLQTVLKAGARLAEPGEFTKRAFLNGRIDLSQAEAVIDTIHAKNRYALSSSLGQIKGSLSNKIKELREKLLYEIAFIESALDDPEHISLDGYRERLLSVIGELEEELEKLIGSFSDGRLLSEGIRTVILGKPNVGKSSLLNVLVGEERAIVTEIAGTTRDVLEENILMEGLNLHIMDTAGIRSTEDKVERIGISKALKEAEEADLILYVADASVPLDENDEQIIDFIRDKRAVVLFNKDDLNPVLSFEELQKSCGHSVLSVSAKEKTGFDSLKQEIRSMFEQRKIDFNDQILITNVRQERALSEAFESVQLVKKGIHEGLPEDFYSIDLMNAYEKLGLIIGEAVEDDLIHEIFSRFCMGK